MEPQANKNIVLDDNGNAEFVLDNGRYIYKLKPFIDMNLSGSIYITNDWTKGVEKKKMPIPIY